MTETSFGRANVRSGAIAVSVGRAKALVDGKTSQIAGENVPGCNIWEPIQRLVPAMAMSASLTDAAATAPARPGLGEPVKDPRPAALGKPVHI